MLARQLRRLLDLPRKQRPQSRVHAVDVVVGERRREHGVDVAEDVIDVGFGGRRVREVEIPVGVGGADDPVRAPWDHEQHGLLGAQDDRHLADDAVARHHHVHTLGRADTEPAALLGQRLDLVGPHAGRVDHHMAVHLGDVAVLGVSDLHAGDAITLAQQRDRLGRRPNDRSIVSRGARHVHRVPGVVDDGVVVADATDQRTALEARRQPQGARLEQMLLCGNGFGAAELVVEKDACRHVGPLPPPVGQREQER